MSDPLISGDEHRELGARVILGRIFALGWRYKWLFVATLGVSASSAALYGYLPQAFERLIDAWSTIQNKEALPEAEIQVARDQMNHTALITAALAVPAGLLFYAAYYAGQMLANAVIRDLRLDFVMHLVRLDLGFHSSMRKGDLLTRMMDDLNRLRSMVQRVYGRILQRPFILIAVVGFMLWTNIYLGLFLLATLIPITVILVRLVGKIKRRSTDARKALTGNVVAFEQIISGIRVIKAMGSAEREGDRFASTNATLYHKLMRVARSRATSEGLTFFGVFAMVACFLWLGNWLFMTDKVKPSEMISALGALAIMTSVLRELQHAIGDLVQHAPAAERVFDILDRVPAIADDPNAPSCPAPQTAISLNAIRFRYHPDADDVLRDISLRIPVGRTVAMVGASGGGKSTLLDLIPRLHDVTEGSIQWDDADVRSYNPSSVVHQCAIVQQDAFLFDDTVLENIRYGRPDASLEEVQQAARRAHVHDDIERLEGGDGYLTRVGDRGSRLSGGQRQRVAIARALLRDAPVLLLDEPTSALDATSEEHVQRALAELMTGRTTIMIAHRLATIRHADCIYVLGGKDDGDLRGRIVESGTHDELIAKGGLYAGLVAKQNLG